MKKSNTRLYNLFFPVWLLFAHPLLIGAALPVNLLIDFLVIFLTLGCLGVENRTEIATAKIWRTWGLGFAADAIGAAILFFLSVILPELAPATDDAFGSALYLNPFRSLPAILIMLAVIALVGVLIYWFNYSYVFSNTTLTKREQKRVCLMLATLTAPYLFLLPTAWFVI